MSEQEHDRLPQQQRSPSSGMAYEQAGQVKHGHQNRVLYPDQPAEIITSFEVGEGENNLITAPAGDQSRTRYNDSFNVGKGSNNVIMSVDHPDARKAVEHALKLLYPNTEKPTERIEVAQVVIKVIDTSGQMVPSAEYTSLKKSRGLLAWLFRRRKDRKQNKASLPLIPRPPAFGERPSQ